ncbi:two pore segment channel 3 isoform X2 [Amia ocellicauda]|uniref:two pore segment channel 3 isoform X2 n=1 Tax=Amia ocellicauda TaxID=2972642 RepID=UPI003463AE67
MSQTENVTHPVSMTTSVQSSALNGDNEKQNCKTELATSVGELICLCAFTVRLVHYAKVIPRQKFWKDPKNICIMIVILLTLVDMIIFGSLKAFGYYGVRWSRVLRPLFLVNITEGRQVRRAFRSIRNTLPQILYVFLLFMFSILMFSLMALKLFGKRKFVTQEGTPYFTNYLDIVFELYVLVTTANSPDVMMPAYNNSLFFAAFFVLYIVINTYIFMYVFLAVVYNNYKKHLKEEVRQVVRAKRDKMVRAFVVLQESRGGQPVVAQEDWNQLVKMVQPDISTSHRQLLWSVCNEDKNGYIGKAAFVQLADLLNIQVITLKSRIHPLQIRFPRLYSSAASRLICRLVRHKGFIYIYDLVILVNAVFIGLDEENPLISNAEWVFLGLYLLEILLKLYTYEPRSFFARHEFWNWFDTIIIISALVATIANSAMKSSGGYTSRQILDIVFILRVLRLIRIVDSIKRFRAIINTIIKIGPTIITFGQLIIVVYYIFAVIGMESFKGKITFYGFNSSDPASAYCGNPLLKDSAFARHNYCKNNFNDIVSSFILLLELTVVNQWNVLTNGFTVVTHVAARIYFVVFHIVVVIIIINILVAFILEAFFVEYTLEKCDLQTSIEKKIQELELGIEQDEQDKGIAEDMETQENDLGPAENVKGKSSLMFRIASKRYKTVDTLLQRIFEADLGPEDNGCSLDECGEDPDNPLSPGFQNPTFDSI